MYKQCKNYRKVFYGVLLATGCANAMAPASNNINALIAFLSGGLSRLGVNSPVGLLDQQVAREISRLAFEKDVEIISEDETTLSVRLQQPEAAFDREVILGPSPIFPHREARVHTGTVRQGSLAVRNIFMLQQPQIQQVIPQIVAVHAVHQSREMVRMAVFFGDCRVSVSDMAGEMRKACTVALSSRIRDLRISQQSIVPVDDHGQRLQPVPLDAV
jgi:hypothetical protein